MSNDRIWITKDRRKIKIKDMTDTHLINAARMILSRGFRRDYLPDLAYELDRRQLEFTYEGPTFEGKQVRVTRSPKKKKSTKTKEKHKWVVFKRPKSNELCLADHDTDLSKPCKKHKNHICPETNSKRHDPYAKKGDEQ